MQGNVILDNSLVAFHGLSTFNVFVCVVINIIKKESLVMSFGPVKFPITVISYTRSHQSILLRPNRLLLLLLIEPDLDLLIPSLRLLPRLRPTKDLLLNLKRKRKQIEDII